MRPSSRRPRGSPSLAIAREPRFFRDRLRGLEDRARSGRPTKFDPEQRGKLLALACEDPAEHGHRERTHWELDLLVAEAIGEGIVSEIGRSTVARRLEAGAIRPHHVRYWLHSRDPDFERKQRGVLRLYLHPSPDEVVVSFDEKSQMQALERLVPTELPRPHRPGADGVRVPPPRHAVLFAAFEIHTGRVFGRHYRRQRLREWLRFLPQLVRRYPGRRVRIVLDNLKIHDHPAVHELLRRWRGRVTLHFTPKHASWLNQVEIWFSILQRRLLRRGSFSSLDDLARRVLSFLRAWNREALPFRWTYAGQPLAA